MYDLLMPDLFIRHSQLTTHYSIRKLFTGFDCAAFIA